MPAEKGAVDLMGFGVQISILRRLKHKNIVRLFNVLNPTDPPAPLKSLYVFFEYAGWPSVELTTRLPHCPCVRFSEAGILL
eukprot:730428-Rhodomonas_salina.2